MQDGELIFYDSRGYSDVETNACVNDTSLFRIYSMTKIVTSVAALMLYEEGYFGLNDPIYDYIPEFKEMYVLSGKSEKQLKIMPAKRPITIKHLMTHTAGFTYSFNDSGGIIESMYKTADLDFNPNGVAFSEWVKALVKIPLLFHPGERWNYGVSTDILGYFIEIISGQSLSNFFSQRIFDPLNMNSTSFELNNDLQNRLVTLYKYKEPYQMDLIETAKSSIFAGPITRYQGGAGLISSGHDYLNFLEMLRSAGKHGNLRILKSKTIDLMTSNQLPGDLASMGQTSFGETNFNGIGFGLGVAVVIDPVKSLTPSSKGEYGWGGAASTACWVDPLRKLSVIFMTQLYPSDTYDLRQELKKLVYKAIVA